MKKFCKPLYFYMTIFTAISCMLALMLVSAYYLLFLERFGLITFLLILISPGTTIMLVGTVLGWIGGFLDMIKLSVTAVIVISIGFALWFWLIFPIGVIAGLVVALIPGLICCKKQNEHINAQKACSENQVPLSEE